METKVPRCAGLIYNEEASPEELVPGEQHLCVKVSKTKELIVDFGRKQAGNYHPLRINRVLVERVDSSRYLSVCITEDLSWSSHVDTSVKEARQHVFHLRGLRDFRLQATGVLSALHTLSWGQLHS